VGGILESGRNVGGREVAGKASIPLYSDSRSAVTGTTLPILLLLPILYTPFGLWRFFKRHSPKVLASQNKAWEFVEH
jgi:hypothetical protein